MESTLLNIALIGNPNTGKSTLFSALVGVRQHVGNYPGVTVEKKMGRLEHDGRGFELIDLPGLYSLAPRSRDEMVAVDVLLGRFQNSHAADAVLCVVDASNLSRSLYLFSQVLELGLPIVVALNMTDVAERHGVRIDAARLADNLGVPVVAVQANRRIGLDRLKAALTEAVGEKIHSHGVVFPNSFEAEVSALTALLQPLVPHSGDAAIWPRFLLRRLLLDASGYLQRAMFSQGGDELTAHLHSARLRLADENCPIPALEARVRHAWAAMMLEGAVTEQARERHTLTDRVDRVLTHRFWGTLIFALVMLAVFQAVFVWAMPVMSWIDALSSAAGHWIESHAAEGAVRSLLVDGVLAGVGSVLSFLPQIVILFCFIGILEDCGYMARAAFLMDRLMVRVGLSGRSFIPLLSSCACAVPGIMATRVIENERDRLTTMLVAPLLPCSARLPVYALLIAAFVPSRSWLGGLLQLQGLALAGLYVLGIGTAILAALIFKKTIFRGAGLPLLLELPGYQWPSVPTVLHRVVARCRAFLRTAGTLIVAVSVVVWAALYYPRGPQAQQSSVLAGIGRLAEPLVRPLGWDWRIGCAVLASLPARETVVATMSVMFGASEDADEPYTHGSTRLQDKLRAATWEGSEEPLFNVPVALSILVFFALCAQCAATLAVIRRETNGWRWPAFTFAYMNTLAYLGALFTYQLGMWLSR